jgi:hypothetical protein
MDYARRIAGALPVWRLSNRRRDGRGSGSRGPVSIRIDPTAADAGFKCGESDGGQFTLYESRLHYCIGHLFRGGPWAYHVSSQSFTTSAAAAATATTMLQTRQSLTRDWQMNAHASRRMPRSCRAKDALTVVNLRSHNSVEPTSNAYERRNRSTTTAASDKNRRDRNTLVKQASVVIW